MSHQSLNTHGRTRLSFANEADIDEFVVMLEKYERGEITPDQWRGFRLLRGTYGQRQSYDASMLRVKIPQGMITSDQMNAMADVADRYSRKFGHITTRQNIQLHFIKLHDMEPAMRLLAEVGMTTREACGNSVRNITACPFAGTAADEVFDVTPYSDALTRFLLRHRLSSSLPRKFKIAFEGCRDDHAALAINDLGFKAELGPNGERGFRVVAGGGTALMCKVAGEVHAFTPATELFRVSEAILMVFKEHGDYEHRQRNRMKFMIKKLGWDRFVEEYQKNYTWCVNEGQVPTLEIETPDAEPAPTWTRTEAQAPSQIAARVASVLPIGPGITPVVLPVLATTDEQYARWKQTNVRAQRQFGFVTVTVTVPLGDLTSEQMRVLGDLAKAYGDGSMRVTVDQNLVIRWVPVGDVHELYRRLAAASLSLGDAATVADVNSCPGAECCRLAVTQSRGLGRLLGDTLRARPDLVQKADGAVIKISGCPNGCGQHHVATLGFQGSVRRVGGKAVPQYFVMIGGGTTATGAAFARIAAKIPARRIPEATERLIQYYDEKKRDGETAPEFFQRIEVAHIKALLLDLEQVTEQTATPDDFIDLGETGEFAPEVMEGECSA